MSLRGTINASLVDDLYAIYRSEFRPRLEEITKGDVETEIKAALAAGFRIAADAIAAAKAEEES